MASSDIRENYDPEGADGEIVAAILDTRPPLWSGRNQSSGLDCLIVVLRRIYSHTMLDPGTSDYLDLAGASEKNPILNHAWHMFGQSREEVQEATKSRMEVSKALEKMSYSSQGSFEEICNSSLMNDTFWSHVVFRLSEPIFCPRTGDDIHETLDDVACQSLLNLDQVAHPDMNLQDVVNNAFGRVHRGGKEAFSRPSRPWVIRLRYQPSSEPQSRLDINGLRSLQLPVWGVEKNQPTLSFEEVGKTDYFLLAVVRLRSRESSSDFVRTYQSHGANTVAEYEPSTFVYNDWSVKDSPGRYMLFYGQASGPPSIDDPRRFPEVAPAQKVDVALFERIGANMSRRMARLNETAQSEPVSEAQVQHVQPQVSQPVFTASQSETSSRAPVTSVAEDEGEYKLPPGRVRSSGARKVIRLRGREDPKTDSRPQVMDTARSRVRTPMPPQSQEFEASQHERNKRDNNSRDKRSNSPKKAGKKPDQSEARRDSRRG
ncbi:hypothetical protein ACHAPJ_011264 [Fusarium lateritium]